MFAHVQVQHELDQGTVHDREVAGQDGVSRSCQARCGAEVHLAQRFAEGHVVLHIVAGGTRIAPAFQFAVGAFVVAVRHGFIEKVGQVQLDLAQAGLDGLELAAGVAQTISGLLDLALERVHVAAFAGGHADLLRQFVAFRAQLLHAHLPFLAARFQLRVGGRVEGGVAAREVARHGVGLLAQ